MAIAADTTPADIVTFSAKATTSLISGAVTLVKGQIVLVSINVLLSKGNTTITSVTDGLGNSYSLLVAASNGALVRSELWGAFVKTGGSTTITVTPAASTTLACAATQYSGASFNTGKTSTNTSSISGTSVVSTAIVTAAGGAWIVGAAAAGAGTATFSAGAATNQRAQLTTSGGAAATNCGVAAADSGNVATLGTSTTLTETLSASENWAFVAAELDPTVNVSQPLAFGFRPPLVKAFGQSLSFAFAVAAAKPGAITVSRSQPLTMGFAAVKGATKSALQSTTVLSLASRTTSRTVTSSLSFSFAAPKSVTRSASQALTLTTLEIALTTKAMSQPLTFSFTPTALRTRLTSVAQPLTMGFARTLAPTASRSQTLTAGFAVIKGATKAAAQGLAFGFVLSTVKSRTQTVSQAFTFGFARTSTTTMFRLQPLTFGTAPAKSATKAMTQTFTFGFVLLTLRTSTRTFAQPLTIGFVRTSLVVKASFSGIAFATLLARSVSKLAVQGLTFSFIITTAKTTPALSVAVKQPLTIGFALAKSDGKAAGQSLAFGFSPAKLVSKSLPPFGLSFSFVAPVLATTLVRKTDIVFTLSITAKPLAVGIILNLEQSLRDLQTLALYLKDFVSGTWGASGVVITAADAALLETSMNALLAKIKSDLNALQIL